MRLDQIPNLLIAFSKASDGNMSFLKGDPKEAWQNREKFLKALGIEISQVVTCQLEHGTKILRVGKSDLGKFTPQITNIPMADGLLTNEKGVYLFFLTADCLPILLCDPKKQAISLVHAGWKGIDLEIPQIAVKKMVEEFSSDPSQIQALIGPSIGPCCYKGFLTPKDFTNPDWPKYQHYDKSQILGLDLWSFAQDQLQEAGLLKENIFNPQICSYHSGEYFSHCKSELEHLDNDFRFATVFGVKA